MEDTIVTGIVGVVASILGATTSWFFTRRKYNEEVKKSVFENYEQRFEFQDKIIANLQEKIDASIKIEKNNETKIIILKDVIKKMLNDTCTDYSCKSRNSYSIETMTEILDKL